MMRSAFTGTVLFAAIVTLTGCAGSPADAPADSAPAESAPSETVVPESEAQLPSLDGEWVFTRTVVEGNASSEVFTVGFTEDRLVAFQDSDCDETCVGTALSGATLEGRSATEFEQSEAEITFQYTGVSDCLDTDTGALLMADGYEYVLEYRMTVDAASDAEAETLTGTALNLYTPTAEAVAAGCETDTGRIEYEVTAARS